MRGPPLTRTRFFFSRGGVRAGASFFLIRELGKLAPGPATCFVLHYKNIYTDVRIPTNAKRLVPTWCGSFHCTVVDPVQPNCPLCRSRTVRLDRIKYCKFAMSPSSVHVPGRAVTVTKGLAFAMAHCTLPPPVMCTCRVGGGLPMRRWGGG